MSACVCGSAFRDRVSRPAMVNRPAPACVTDFDQSTHGPWLSDTPASSLISGAVMTRATQLEEDARDRGETARKQRRARRG
jgi:hypothetical protein